MTPPAAPASPLRPAFRDGQVLRAGDLGAETAALAEAARRHQQFAHRAGIVGGLWLDLGHGTIPAVRSVSPGMALDAAGRTILVLQSTYLPAKTEPDAAEVWIAYREADQRPNRTVESYDLLWEAAGRYDPAQPGDHPLGAVFLGTPGLTDAHAGRLYAGAVGARVESASGKARLLLGPEAPGDLRLFAVGTAGAAPGEYRDHLTVDSTGAVRLNDPVSVARRPDANGDVPPVAAVAVGLRAVEFRAADVLDPRGLWDQVAPLLSLTKEPPAAERLCARLAGLLNRQIAKAGAKADGARELEALVRKAGAAFRPETVRLLLARDAGTHRDDPRRLARLLLEDAFPTFLRRLPAVDDGPLGVGFVGLRPTPTAALPGCVYLAAADKTATRRELRFEVEHPGKNNNPERYLVAVGTVGPAARLKPTDPDTAFVPVLTADASGAVTINGDLRVYTKKPTSTAERATGLIAQIEKPAAPGDPPGKPAGLGLVSPLDLSLEGVVVARPIRARLEVTDGQFLNTGGGEVVNVQLIATVFATDRTNGFRPETTPLLRKLAVGPGQKVKFTETTGGAPLAIPIRSEALKTVPVTVVLSVYGHGPGLVLLSGEQDFPLPVVPPA